MCSTDVRIGHLEYDPDTDKSSVFANEASAIISNEGVDITVSGVTLRISLREAEYLFGFGKESVESYINGNLQQRLMGDYSWE